jgi:hypothetical protein
MQEKTSEYIIHYLSEYYIKNKGYMEYMEYYSRINCNHHAEEILHNCLFKIFPVELRMMIFDYYDKLHGFAEYQLYEHILFHDKINYDLTPDIKIDFEQIIKEKKVNEIQKFCDRIHILSPYEISLKNKRSCFIKSPLFIYIYKKYLYKQLCFLENIHE